MTVNARLVGFFYAFIFFLALVSPIQQGLLVFFSGFVFVLISYLVFLLGGVSVRTVKTNITKADYSELSDKIRFWISIISLPCSLYAIYFYTGKSLNEVLSSLILGLSNYNEYQQFFRDNNLYVFSFSKVGGIISLFVVKLSLILSMSAASIYGFNSVRILSVIFSSISMIYVSLGRGTSFEIFELLLLVLFYTHIYFSVHRRKISLRSLFILFICMSLALFFYWLGISVRYSGDYVPQSSNQLIYNVNSEINNVKVLSSILFQLSNYFLVGPLYLSGLIEKIFHNHNLLFSFILPGSGAIESMDSGFLCSSDFDCGVAWTPSIEGVLLKLGFIGCFIFIYILGMIDKIVSSSMRDNPNVTDSILLFYLFLALISFPVGNFIGNSSSNILIIMLAMVSKTKRFL
ncbi:TPA: oligosaccharide repeat unit polymerase [Vibrio vulnificus]|nr:oligosaccharide repeat unit polymerase [Vibrio vulnificus]